MFILMNMGHLIIEDEYDEDSQSLEGIETREEISMEHHYQQGPTLQNFIVEEVREVTRKKGLSTRGRKVSKQIKNASTTKPNTTARSGGLSR